MPYKILTTQITSIDNLVNNPFDVLKRTKDGTIAILINNIPIFYAVTPERLANLLNIESNAIQSMNNMMLNNKFFKRNQLGLSITVTKGKFAMHENWKPDANFQHLAALWGILLTYPVTVEELASFISYWQAEGNILHHMQWQQKLARILQIKRAKNSQFKHDINSFSEPDKQIPKGFRGVK